jgi:hypothetical protein
MQSIFISKNSPDIHTHTQFLSLKESKTNIIHPILGDLKYLAKDSSTTGAQQEKHILLLNRYERFRKHPKEIVIN